MKRTVLSSLILIASASGSSGQDGPSYEETVAFISEKVGNYRDSYDDGLYNRYDWEYSVEISPQCKLRVVAEMEGGLIGGNPVDGREMQTVDLKLADPSTVSAGPDTVYFETTSDAEVVHTENAGTGKYVRSQEFYKNSILIAGIGNAEVANRTAKAFEHLIRLCGGKEELF